MNNFAIVVTKKQRYFIFKSMILLFELISRHDYVIQWDTQVLRY